MNNIERIYRSDPSALSFAKGYLAHLQSLLGKMDSHSIARFIDVMLTAREKGVKVFFIGNGGSAATASHFANDIAIGTRSPSKPFRALSLTDNVPVITAIANDFGYENVFVKQLETLLKPADIVVAISVSGNSPNVVKAVEYAKSRGAFTVGITGFDGGVLKRNVSLSIHVPSERGEYGPVEDLHMVLDHLLGAYLTLHCQAENQSGTRDQKTSPSRAVTSPRAPEATL